MGTEEMFDCQLCREENDGNNDEGQKKNVEFVNLDELEAHLASEHFNCLPYECEQCQFAKFPTEFAVMRHNEQDHSNKVYSFHCRITPAIKKKRIQIREYLLTIRGAPFPEGRPQLSDNRNISLPAQQQRSAIAKKKSAAEESQSRYLTTAIKTEMPDDAEVLRQEHKSADTNSSSRSSFGGGKMQIRDGRKSRQEGNKGGTAEDNQFRQQEADVQEILKAAAAASSQVAGLMNSQAAGGSGGKRRTNPANHMPYSLRPNRFSPYIFLHQKQQNWQQRFGLYGGKASGGISEGGGGGDEAAPIRIQFKNERVVDRIRCKKCGEMVNSTGGCLMHHLNTRHLHLPLFQCKLCKKDFYEVSNTRIHKHMRIHHGGDTSQMVSNYAKYSHSLHAGRDECFGTREERLRAIRDERVQQAANQNEIDPINDSNRKSKMVGPTGLNASNSLQSATQTCATVRAVFQQKDDFKYAELEESSSLLSGSGTKLGGRNVSQDDDFSISPANYDDTEDLDLESAILEGELARSNPGDEYLQQEEEEEQQFEDDGEEEDELSEADRAPPLTKGAAPSSSSCQQQSNNGNNDQGSFPPAKMGGKGERRLLLYPMMKMQMGTEEKVPCGVCGEMVLNKLLNRLNHVNVRHLQLPLHQCRLCQKSFTSYSRSACSSHVQFAHKAEMESGKCSQNVEDHIVYMKEKFNSQLLEAANNYFD